MPAYINMSNDIINRYDINFYIKNSIGNITLEVNTDNSGVRYNISTDWSHPDLEKIYYDLRNGLSYAFDHGKDIYIDDYSDCNYICITYPNGDFRKYPASKEFIY